MPTAPVSQLAGEIPCPLLREIMSTGFVQTPQGKRVSLVGSISPDYAVALYRAIKTYRPKTIIEIGMASGVSSLSMLSALNEIGEGGRLITIDAFQNDPNALWAGVGLANIQRAAAEVLETGRRLDTGSEKPASSEKPS